MKRIIPITVVLLLVLGTAFGCSTKSAARADNEYASAADAYYAEPQYEPEMPAEMADASFASESKPAPMPNASAALSNRKIIRNADMTVETLSFDAFLDQLNASVDSVGGYMESSSVGNRGIRNGQKLRYGHYTIRIPADRLDAFLNTVSGLGNVISQNTGLRDVTTSYVDSEKHLEALRTEQTALLDILAKATTVEDIITVQDRLTYVRYEIESYEAILRTYDDQIALSSVSLTVNEVERETPVVEETFGEEVSRRFKESMQDVGDGFRDFASWFLGNAPEIIVVIVILGVNALIVILIVKGVKRRIRKNREKKNNEKHD